MSIAFDKRKTQRQCECYMKPIKDALPAGTKYKFSSYVITAANEAALNLCAQDDARDMYFNALLSFLDACESMRNNNSSWACVQFYYSLFYSLRAYMAFDGYVLIRDNSLYLVKIQTGMSPITKQNKKYNTDHGGTINYYKDLYQATDNALALLIDDTTVLDWMMDLRETTNYREHSFLEPQHRAFLQSYMNLCNQADFYQHTLDSFDADTSYTYMLTEASAWIAIPYYYLKQAAVKFKLSAVSFNDDQDDLIVEKLDILGISSKVSCFI